MLGYLKARYAQLWSFLTACFGLLLSFSIVRVPLTFLIRIWSFRMIRWPVKILFWTSIVSNVFEMSLFGLDAFGIVDVETIDNFFSSNIDYYLPNPDPVADFSSTNPYRELPNDPAVLAAIKESALLIQFSVHDSRVKSGTRN